MINLFPNRCPICSSVQKKKGLCPHCQDILSGEVYHNYRLEGLEEIHIAFEYKKGGKELIRTFKFKGKTGLVEVIGDLLCDKLLQEELHKKYDYLTYVPMTKKEESQRGFNPSKILCQYVAQSLDLSMVELFIKVRETKRQVELDQQNRRTNLIDAFSSKFHVPSLLIIDDVITTGATVEELAKVAKVQGIKKVAALLAATHQSI